METEIVAEIHGEDAADALLNTAKDNEFNFDQWVSDLGLTRKVEKVLRAEEMTTKKVLVLMDQGDVMSLTLPLGQRKLLWSGIQDLQGSKPNHITGGPLPANLEPEAADTNQGQRLGGREANRIHRLPTDTEDTVNQHTHRVTEQGLPLTDIAHAVTNLLTEEMNPAVSTDATKASNKSGDCVNAEYSSCDPLDLYNFVNSFLNDTDSKQETLLSNFSEGSKLVIKRDKAMARLDNLSPVQWCAANCRIIQQILSSGGNVSQYVEYVKRICELGDFYQWQSILKYDQAFRSHRYKVQGKWDADYPHLDRLYLRLGKQNGTLGPRVDGSSKGSNFRNHSDSPMIKETCWLYNQGRCHYKPCKFIHSCSLPNCNEQHPRYQHSFLAQSSKNGVAPHQQ